MSVPLSAGLLLYRRRVDTVEVFLVHPGGPYFTRRDDCWGLPKGLVDPDEDLLDAAKREYNEETGLATPPGDDAYIDLGVVRQSNKRVHAWAFEGDADPEAIESNTFELEWPPKSGKRSHFPEVDRAAWFPVDEAAGKIVKAQAEFLLRLVRRLVDEAGGR